VNCWGRVVVFIHLLMVGCMWYGAVSYR